MTSLLSSSHSSAAVEVLKVPAERRILRLDEINREMKDRKMRALQGEPEIKIINHDERFICGIRILHRHKKDKLKCVHCLQQTWRWKPEL